MLRRPQGREKLFRSLSPMPPPPPVRLSPLSSSSVHQRGTRASFPQLGFSLYGLMGSIKKTISDLTFPLLYELKHTLNCQSESVREPSILERPSVSRQRGSEGKTMRPGWTICLLWVPVCAVRTLVVYHVVKRSIHPRCPNTSH